MKRTILHIATYIIAGILILFGIAHFFIVDELQGFFPEFVPVGWQLWAIYVSGVAEVALGIGLVIPKYREWSALLVFLMLVVYLPLHIRDLMIDHPVMRSHTAAIIRVIAQFLVLYLMWMIKTQAKKDKEIPNEA